MNAKEYGLTYDRLIGMIEAHMNNDENVVITEKLLDDVIFYHQTKSGEDIPYLEHMNRLIDSLLANEHDHSNTEELSVMIKDWLGELKAAFGKEEG